MDQTAATDAVSHPPLSPRHAWLVRNRGLLGRVAALGVVTGLIVMGLVMWVTGRFESAAIGYPTVWLFSFIGAASIFIPLPAPAGVCIGATPAFNLDPVLLGVVSGTAEVLGELTGYMAGLTGRSIVERSRWYPAVQQWMKQRGALVLFCMAIIPNPLFDIVGVASGSIGYPLRKFVPIVFVSKSIKSAGIAFGCYHGISFIQGLFR
jgi:membrane protein YqaA with SNARE-associated domain